MCSFGSLPPPNDVFLSRARIYYYTIAASRVRGWGWRVICSIIIHRDRHAIDSTHHHMLTLCVNALYRHCLRYNVCSIALKTLCRYNIMINHITTYRPKRISRNLKTKYLSSIYFIKYYIIWRYTCVAVFPSINLYPFKQKLYLHICYILYRTPRTIEHITNMLRSTCAHHFIRETNISRMWRARSLFCNIHLKRKINTALRTSICV